MYDDKTEVKYNTIFQMFLISSDIFIMIFYKDICSNALLLVILA